MSEEMTEQIEDILGYFKKEALSDDEANKVLKYLHLKELDEDSRNQLIEQVKSHVLKIGTKYMLFSDLYLSILNDFVHNVDDGDFAKECINNEEICGILRDSLLSQEGDEYKEEYLRSGAKIGLLYITSKSLGKDKVLEFLESQEVAPETKVALVHGIGEQDLLDKFTKKIKNVSELSLSDLDNLPDIGEIIVEDPESAMDLGNHDVYTRSEYTQIRKAVDEIVKGIDKPIKGDFESEFNALKEVLKRLSFIEYNHRAYDLLKVNAGFSNKIADINLSRNSENLYGGLIEGQSVCGRIF